ncbi:MAG: M42 family metallopeptidase [Eggerthellaceae bacterium]|nr:M42 family metallopeptidase [Eggerthellaceae bacterium]
MKKKNVKFLKRLLETPSPTGCEEPVAALVRERLSGTADEVVTDTMGTVMARLEGKGDGPSLMLAAHMDEVGLMVTYISDDGFLSVAMVGGVDAAVLPGMRMDVHAKDGVLRGIVGRKPIHLIEPDERKSVTPLDKLVIDLGLPAEEVKRRVRIGDEITYGVGFERFGKGMAVSRAFDDKCGVYVAVRVLENLAKAGRAEGDFVAAATVQEEIGTRGAMTAAHSVNPDVALAFDVTHATDYPGIDKTKYGKITCGEGPVIARGPNINPVVFERLVAAAEAEGIPYQLEAEPSVTGTDARAIQVTRGGIPTGLISVPLRYMHTPTEVVCLADLDATVRLITRFALDLHSDLSFVPGMGGVVDGADNVSADEQIEDILPDAAAAPADPMEDVIEDLDREVSVLEEFISTEE